MTFEEEPIPFFAMSAVDRYRVPLFILVAPVYWKNFVEPMVNCPGPSKVRSPVPSNAPLRVSILSDARVDALRI